MALADYKESVYNSYEDPEIMLGVPSLNDHDAWRVLGGICARHAMEMPPAREFSVPIIDSRLPSDAVTIMDVPLFVGPTVPEICAGLKGVMAGPNRDDAGIARELLSRTFYP